MENNSRKITKGKTEGKVVAPPKSHQDSSPSNPNTHQNGGKDQGKAAAAPKSDQDSSHSIGTILQDGDKNKGEVEAAGQKSHHDSPSSNPTILPDGKPINVSAEIQQDDDDSYGDIDEYDTEVQDANFRAFLEQYNLTEKVLGKSSNQNPNGSQTVASAVESPDLHQTGIYNSGNQSDDKKTGKETSIPSEKKGEVEQSRTKCVVCEEVQLTSVLKQAAKCGHHFCSLCFSKHVVRKITEILDPSISCPKVGCTETLSDKEITDFLLPKARTRWDAVQNYRSIKKMQAKLDVLLSTARESLLMINDTK